MKRILISTIMRNEEKFLDMWYSQIKGLVETYGHEFEFFLSVYENDSTDKTFSKLVSFDWSFMRYPRFVSESMGFPYFIGGMNADRVKILAHARNSSIFNFSGLKHMDYVLVIEPDVKYDVKSAGVILCDHEKTYGQKFDILTAKSCHVGSPERIYDSWGTRIKNDTDRWHEGDNVFGGLEPLWSSFNCFALYNAEPIKKGVGFNWFNKRFNSPDCDTAVICEDFRAAGHDKIYWNTNFYVEHFCE